MLGTGSYSAFNGPSGQKIKIHSACVHYVMNYVSLCCCFDLFFVPRFIVPKDEFMRLNRKSGDGGEIIPTKRKYTRRSEVHQPFKVRILPPSQKRGRRST